MRRFFLLALLSMAALAQPPPDQRYRFSIGEEAETIHSGTVWLYSYSWYGLQKLELASIQNGVAMIPMDSAKLKRKLEPHPNTDAYVLIIQIGQHLWYRTPNISPDVFWRGYPRSLESLGQATIHMGEPQVVLPRTTQRRIRLLYPDGRPAANAKLDISIYLYDTNRCGAHFGLPLGTFRTDQKGSVLVQAPLVPLYLDGVGYFENKGRGPAGVAYSTNSGLKLGPEEVLVVKKAWVFKDEDQLRDEFEVQVLAANGVPREDMAIWEQYRTNTCGGGEEAGRTDARGVAKVGLEAETVTSLGLTRSDGQKRELTDAELRQLFSRHKLTVRW